LRADATAGGAGGRVIVWADDTTRFFGDISATGFSSGGFAVVSGKTHLTYAGLADLRAASSGQNGTLLLDPDNITISTAATSGVVGTGTFTAPDGENVLNADALAAQLGNADVVVKTSAGDITLAAGLDVLLDYGNRSLTLDAGRDIFISGAGGVSFSGNYVDAELSLSLLAGRNISVADGAQIAVSHLAATAGGAISLAGEIWASQLTAASAADFALSGDVHAGNLSLSSLSGTVGLGAGSYTSAPEILVSGGLAIAEGARIDGLTSVNMTVWAGDRDVVSNAALSLSSLAIGSARHISLGAVVTMLNQGYAFDGAIELKGPLTSYAGEIEIAGSHATRPGHATVFSTSAGGINITAANGLFWLGERDTLAALGDGNSAGAINITALAISAGGMSATRSITLSADTITLAAGAVLQAPAISFHTSASGGIYPGGNDPGATSIIRAAEGAAAVPRLPWLVFDTIPAVNMTGDAGAVRDGFVTLPPGGSAPFPSLYRARNFSELLMDPSKGEAVQSVIAGSNGAAEPEAKKIEETLGVVTVSDMRLIDAQTVITDSTRGQLRQLGIFARDLTPGELARMDDYRGVLLQVIPAEARQPEDYRVADGRISEQAARDMLGAYNAVFMRPGPDGKPVFRASEIQSALAAAHKSFSRLSASMPPAAFGSYVREWAPLSPEIEFLRGFLRDIGVLFQRIDSIGLTKNEALVSKTVILRPLLIPGLSTGVLRSIVEQPARPLQTAAARFDSVPPPVLASL
ncbi:MAG: hypothetical protein LBM92_01845, partial [Opitutaceae bacterium]|nr:hypothetical protein [Opitutaceae bacterium]